MKIVTGQTYGATRKVVWNDQLADADWELPEQRLAEHARFDMGDGRGAQPLPATLVESWFTSFTVAHAGEQAFQVVEERGDTLLVAPMPAAQRSMPLEQPEWTFAKPVAQFDCLSQVRFEQLALIADTGSELPQYVGLPQDVVPKPDIDALVDRITALLLEHAPGPWAKIRLGCQATAGWQQLTATLTTPDGDDVAWLPPLMVGQWFHRLRTATSAFPFGAWFLATYHLEPGKRPLLMFNSESEPGWRPYFPDRAAFARHGLRHELLQFPRSPKNTPDWLAAAVSEIRTVPVTVTAGPRHAPKRPFYPAMPARTFDGVDAQGQPALHRQPVVRAEKEALLAFLNQAPAVLTSRGFGPDLLTPGQPQRVPMAFHTDGFWVWPAALAYYLDVHDVNPDVQLLAHIRRSGYLLPDYVPTTALARALATATGNDAEMEPGYQAEKDWAAEWTDKVLSTLNIDRRSFSFGAYRDGALCLVRELDIFVVCWQSEGKRSMYAEFDSMTEATLFVTGYFYTYGHNMQVVPG